MRQQRLKSLLNFDDLVVVFVPLDCSREVLTTRLDRRKELSFHEELKNAMLESQPEVLEVPGRNGNEAEEDRRMLSWQMEIYL
jgi:gluconate kinase